MTRARHAIALLAAGLCSRGHTLTRGRDVTPRDGCARCAVDAAYERRDIEYARLDSLPVPTWKARAEAAKRHRGELRSAGVPT